MHMPIFTPTPPHSLEWYIWSYQIACFGQWRIPRAKQIAAAQNNRFFLLKCALRLDLRSDTCANILDRIFVRVLTGPTTLAMRGGPLQV
jgi:hypothetical protein